jgi:transposase
MNLRKQFSAALNPKVALNALKGKLTFAQLATKYRIQEGQNSSWRKQAFEGIAGTFSGKAEGADVSQQVDVKKLHAQIGLKSIHQKPKTTMPRPGCRKCKYLLKDAAITRPIQVWCADISYSADAQGLPVFGGGCGQDRKSGNMQGALVEAVQRHECRLLYRRSGKDHCPLWQARYSQYLSRLPVYQSALC